MPAPARERSVETSGQFELDTTAAPIEHEHHEEEQDDAERTGELPLIPMGGVESAHAASQLPDNPTVRAAMELDPHWRRALEHSNSELEQWAATQGEGREGSAPSAVARHARTAGERLLGPERTEKVAAILARGGDVARARTRDLRARLEQSEHATLIVAVAVGLVLVAALVAIASATGGSEPKATAKGELTAPTPPAQTNEPAAKEDTKASSAAEPAPKKPAILAPSQIQVNVLNAGGRTGVAHDVAEKLAAQKYKVGEVGNSSSRYGTAVILHPPSLQREAARLSRHTGITTTDKVPETGGPHTITIVVV